MAYMPVLVATAHSVPSIAARRCFKAGHRGVAGAAVGEAVFLRIGKARGGGGAIGLHEAAGHEQRLAVLAPVAAPHAPSARPGFRDAGPRQGSVGHGVP